MPGTPGFQHQGPNTGQTNDNQQGKGIGDVTGGIGAAGQAFNDTITSAINSYFANAVSQFQTQFAGVFAKVGVFLVALILVIIGFWILTSNPVQDVGKRVQGIKK